MQRYDNLVPIHVVCAYRLLGREVMWADYAREILKQAHEIFDRYRSWDETGPWYVTRNDDFSFTLHPCISNRGNSYLVRPNHDFKYWTFQRI